MLPSHKSLPPFTSSSLPSVLPFSCPTRLRSPPAPPLPSYGIQNPIWKNAVNSPGARGRVERGRQIVLLCVKRAKKSDSADV